MTATTGKDSAAMVNIEAGIVTQIAVRLTSAAAGELQAEENIVLPLRSDGMISMRDVVKQLKRLDHDLHGLSLSYSYARIIAFQSCGTVSSRMKDVLLDPAELDGKLDIACSPSKKTSTARKRALPNLAEMPQMKKRKDGGRDHERVIRVAVEDYRQWKVLRDVDRLPVEEAAKQVGVPAKTMYDYKKQFVLGIKYKYDFDANAERKMGHLRHFIADQESNFEQCCVCGESQLGIFPEENESSKGTAEIGGIRQ